MKFSLSSQACLLLAFTGAGLADVPKKALLTRYTSLYTNSPFTAKPPPPEAVDAPNPLDDYALIGVSSIGQVGKDEGYRVTLINKKKPEDRITVNSGQKSDFKILQVIRKPGNPLGTVVKMSAGLKEGTVSFDEKLLTIAAPAPKAPPATQPGQPPIPGQPPVLQPGQPIAQRQPRPRVVPPPAPAGVQPNQPAQPNQPRAQRRGGN